MLDSVQGQIDGFYGRYAGKEGITLAEAKKRVKQADIAAYERKAKRYVKDKDFSPKANEEMRLYNLMMKVNRLEMLKANIGLELISGHDELEKFMEGILQDRTMDELERQAGILGKSVRNNAAKAHAIVNGSFHNGTFSDRIWQYQDLMREEIGRLLQTGLIQGKNPRAIAKDLKKYWFGNDPATGGGVLYCMERLMRTELARVQTEAQKQSFQRNGFGKYMFIVNRGCCDVCNEVAKKNDGIYEVDKMMPGDNAPPLHPHCRCSTAAYEDDAEYNAWLDYLANGGTTEEWNARGGVKAEEKKPKKPGKMSDAKDFDGLDDYLKQRYDISVDKTVKSLDFNSVRDALTGLESVLDKFEGLSETIKKVKTGNGGVMSCSGENITFNPHYFESGEKIQKSCAESSASGWWIKNATPASIGAHECAHAVEWMMLQKNPAYEYDWQRVDAWNKCSEAKNIVSQACKNVKKTDFGKGQRNFQLINTISRYAGETASETMAEAFADVYANGDKASPISIEIERLTIEALKTYEGAE